MPVRSLSSPVFKWPDRAQVHEALCTWVDALVDQQPDVRMVGYIGSYARGDWGVGSDVDLIVVVDNDDTPFLDRTISLDFTEIPVPVDVLTYTASEWDKLINRGGKFSETIKTEIVWIYSKV